MINQCHLGDCRDVMRMLAAAGVRAQTCVTSPPYWGLRDYGVDGQIGLEPTLDEWLSEMVEVFRCVRDMLADDGTIWVNIGDAYCHGTGKDRGPKTTQGDRVPAGWSNRSQAQRIRPSGGIKPKDLIGQPFMLAFALRADGWYLRQDIIWHKPNPMPESIKDRCTKAHEYIFLLSKSERYYYDADAVRERASENTNPRTARNGYKMPDGWDTGDGGHGSFHRQGREKGKVRDVGVGTNARPRKAAPNGSGTKNNASFDEATAVMPEYRNKRSVWTVPTKGFSEAHFATFPPDLIKPCILAGSRPGDIVLDPFMGSGTTGMVAHELGRQWVGAELNPEYMAMQDRRILQGGLPL